MKYIFYVVYICPGGSYSWRIIETIYNLDDRYQLQYFIQDESEKRGFDIAILNWKKLEDPGRSGK